MTRSRLGVVLAAVACLPLTLSAQERFRYPEAKYGKGALNYINGVPVLQVAGNPEEIGEQIGILGIKPSGRLLNYPRDYLRAIKLELIWPVLLASGKALLPNFPNDHRAEMESAVKAAQADRDLFVAANTMFDIKRFIGCSALIVEPERSGTDGVLFGRNLDFPTLGYLDQYTVVILCKPQGKNAFASIGFPGAFGVLSGMNEHGLTLAILECYQAKDNSTSFDPEGTPYALCFRRLLEECKTVDEAEKLLRSMKRTTRLNLAICDPKTSAIFEVTPKTLAVRKAEGGICPCTNHFRTSELAASTECWRYPLLAKCCNGSDKLDVAAVAKKMHEVNQGDLTLQTMVFEPGPRKLHLAIGRPPSSALPLRTLELEPLFRK